MNIVVFEGRDEVIIGNVANINALIKVWFLEGGRDLDEYDIYLTDGKDGFSITAGVKFNDGNRRDYDIIPLLPNELREELVSKGLLIVD